MAPSLGPDAPGHPTHGRPRPERRAPPAGPQPILKVNKIFHYGQNHWFHLVGYGEDKRTDCNLNRILLKVNWVFLIWKEDTHMCRTYSLTTVTYH
jgi:hypothetical protein